MPDWFLRKKKVEKREIQVLESSEKSVTRLELHIVEETIRMVSGVQQRISHGAHLPYWQEDLRKAETKFLALRTYNANLIKLARQLEADLLDIRDSSKEQRHLHLSEDELRVLDYAQRISSESQMIILLMKEIGKNKNYTSAAEQMRRLENAFSHLHKILGELFALERKVEELTAAYIAASG